MSQSSTVRVTFPMMIAARAASDRWAELLTEIFCADKDLQSLANKPVHSVTVSPGAIRVEIPGWALMEAVKKRRAVAMASVMLEFPGMTEEQVSAYVAAWSRD